jgi:hypothetical protein
LLLEEEEGHLYLEPVEAQEELEAEPMQLQHQEVLDPPVRALLEYELTTR